jgi:acyl carrier protein
MTSLLFDKVRSITADVLHVPANQLMPQSSPESIEAWDSIHHLNLILAFEQEFGVQFNPEEVDQMNSVGRILHVLENKLGPMAR